MPKESGPSQLTPDEICDREERMVLIHLLTRRLLTIPELIGELTDGVPTKREAEGIENAVARLAGSGLIHRRGDDIRPTRAAIRFEELTKDF